MSVKEIVLEAIQQLPTDVTYGDVLEEIAILAAIERGQQDVKEGRTIPHDEAKREAMQWTTK